MEQNIPVFAKKIWKLVRVIYVMLRKNISKSKLLLDLNKMMHHRNITTKSLHNLMFHHHHHHHHHHRSPPPGEYEFSCSNSPSTNNHPFSLFTFHKKHHSNNQHMTDDDHDMMAVNAAALKAVAMIHSEAASPVPPGFGWSPVVRQLRVTDSPFPLSGVDEDRHVDEAADRFISRFYDDLRRENSNVTWSRSSS